jgi:hypothetical protein
MPKIRMNSGTIKDVSERDAKILIALKKAVLEVEEEEEKPTKSKRKYKTKTMKADE